MVESFLAFLAVAALVIMTPGQDTALTIRGALGAGRTGGFSVALGVCSGQLVWAVAAGAGLSALLLASEPAFRILKYLGCAYLLYLAALALRDAVRGVPADDDAQGTARSPGPTLFAIYRQGLISNLGNVKVAVFFTSLLPQFATTFWGMLALGALFATFTFCWLTVYSVAVASLGRFLRRTAVRRGLDAATGLVLGGLAVRLAVTD